jgi:hypothetical protein
MSACFLESLLASSARITSNGRAGDSVSAKSCFKPGRCKVAPVISASE